MRAKPGDGTMRICLHAVAFFYMVNTSFVFVPPMRIS